MNSMDLSNQVAEFLTTSGLYSLVLIPIIMIVQWVSGDRLSPTTKHALWLILLIRLSIPALPESRLSLFNFASPTPRVSPLNESPSDTSVPRSTLHSQETGLLTPVLSEPHSTSFAEPTSNLELGNLKQSTPESQIFSPQSKPRDRGRFPQQGEANSTDLESPQTVTPATPIHWQTILLGIWLAGICLLFARVGYSWFQLRKQMHRLTELKDESYAKLIQDCHQALRLRHQVPVFETPLVNSPAICGFMKPRILFPQNFAQNYSDEELTHVLMHELAHQKRRDSIWNLWATLVQIIHWPNPLVWYATLRMRTDRELATDFLALKASQRNEVSAYGETILKSLKTVSHSKPIPGLIGISEDCKSLHRRFTMISRFQKHRRYSITALISVIVSLILITLTDAETESSSVTTASTTSPNAQPIPTEKANTPTPAQWINVSIFDSENDLPLRNVTVGYSFNHEQIEENTIETDATGSAKLPIFGRKGEKIAFTIHAIPPGPRLGQSRTWKNDSIGWPALPDHHSFHLARGEKIGGTVVNFQGEPIVDALLLLNKHPGEMDAYGNQPQLNVTKNQNIRTDQQGQWRYQGAPSNLNSVDIRVHERSGAEHRFTTGRWYGLQHINSTGDTIDKRLLRKGEAVLRIPPSHQITVSVTDESSKPVTQAKITEVRGSITKELSHSETTDESGIATFRGRSEHEMIYCVEHPDYATASKIAYLNQDTILLNITLRPKRPLRGKIIDGTGIPIENALIDLISPTNEDFHTDWSTTSSTNGTFHWDHAPLSDFHFRISAEGHHQTVISANQLRASRTITLVRPTEFRIHLQAFVTDAITGEPIEDFEFAFKNGLDEEFNNPRKGSMGTVDLNVTASELKQKIVPRAPTRYYLCIRAPGYRETISGPIATNEQNPSIRFQIAPIPPELQLENRTILTPEGKPAKGAELVCRDISY